MDAAARSGVISPQTIGADFTVEHDATGSDAHQATAVAIVTTVTTATGKLGLGIVAIDTTSI